MEFNPDGKTLLAAGADGSILLVDLTSGTVKASLPTRHTKDIYSVGFSPDGALFASISADDQVLLFDAVQRVFLKEHSSSDPAVEETIDFTGSRDLAFSPDGSTLAAGFHDGTVHRWRIPSGQEIVPAFSGHTKRVFSVIFSPDGRTLVSGGYDDRLIFWDVESGTPLYDPFSEHRDSILSLAYNHSGTMLASASMDSDIILWELDRGILPPVHSGDIQGLAFSPDGRLLASSGMDNQIVFWDVVSGQMDGQPIETAISAFSPLLFSPDGKLLVSYCDGLCFYDVESRSLLKQTNTYSVLYDSTLAFSPDGTYLASGDGGGNIYLWQPETGTRVSSSQKVFDSEVFALAFSDSGSELYAANGYESRMAVWNLNSGVVEYRTLVSSEQPAFFLRFSPDLRYLAADTTSLNWDEVLMFDPAYRRSAV
ncbi:MAG: hypothetical protein MUO58_13530 [Anaerolineales bacterium]|nr:hypothetical protein [Anaerolineales bacterium]